MLREIEKVRQIEGEPRRRWFSAPRFDLVVWLSSEGAPEDFELCYDKGINERVLVFRQGSLQHRGVDDGEGRTLRQKATPLVVADGQFDPIPVIGDFLEQAGDIERQIGRWVVSQLVQKSLVIRPLSPSVQEQELDRLNLYGEAWHIEDTRLCRDFRFGNFLQAFNFMSLVARVAELMGHHPDWSNSYAVVKVSLTTHNQGDLTPLDFILARVMERLARADLHNDRDVSA